MTSLTLSQIRAINAQIDLGLILQRDYSFVLAEKWVNGSTLLQIAKEEGIIERYGVTQSIAVEGIRKYLCGHNGSFGIATYDGIVPNKKRKEICKEHRTSSEAMSLESRISNGKRISTSMGQIVWLTEEQIMIDEKQLAIALTFSENYRVNIPKRGYRIGDVNCQLVAESLNDNREFFGFPRLMTAKKVRKDLYKYRKKQ